MPNAGDIRVKNGRVYVYTQPDPTKGPGTWRPSNPEALGNNATLVSIDTDSGLEYDSNNDLAVHIGSGLSFDSSGALQSNVTGGVKGAVDLTTSTVPSNLLTGDIYINTGTGTFSSAWAAVTDNADTSTTAAPNDSVVYDGSNFTAIQGGDTNLTVGNRTSTALDIENSAGQDATIPAATTTLAGLMSANDKQAVDDIGDGTLTIKTSAGATLGTFTANQTSGTEVTLPASTSSNVDLSYTANSNSDGTVTNTGGSDATIPVATNSTAGLFTGTEKVKLAGVDAGAQVNPDLTTYIQSGDNVSELTNDSGYITSAQAPVQTSDLSTVATSGSYDDLANKPTIPTIDPNTVIDANYVPTDENFTTADEAKLDGIETSATADQTDAEIRAAIESANDSNVFTDADHTKLNGIAAGAQVNAVTSVNGNTGAVTVTTFSGDYADLTNKPSLGTAAATASTDYATAAQGTKADSALQSHQDISGKADLVNGKLNTSQLPDLAVTEYKGAVADQTAMLAISGEQGDWVIRNDDSKVYLITGDDPTSASDWTALSYPAGFSGAYGDLSGTPALGTAAATASTDYATSAQGTLAASAIQPDDLAGVATSGDYDDLTNKPTIPSAAPVDSVNSLTGAVSLNAGHVGALDLTGGRMTGTLETTERNISASAFDLSTGNHWTCGAITVPNPTNAVAGTSGLIRITAGPVSWGGYFKFPGSTAPTIASFPAIIPFYVQSSSAILMGNVSEGIL